MQLIQIMPHVGQYVYIKPSKRDPEIGDNKDVIRFCELNKNHALKVVFVGNNGFRVTGCPFVFAFSEAYVKREAPDDFSHTITDSNLSGNNNGLPKEIIKSCHSFLSSIEVMNRCFNEDPTKKDCDQVRRVIDEQTNLIRWLLEHKDGLFPFSERLRAQAEETIRLIGQYDTNTLYENGTANTQLLLIKECASSLANSILNQTGSVKQDK